MEVINSGRALERVQELEDSKSSIKKLLDPKLRPGPVIMVHKYHLWRRGLEQGDFASSWAKVEAAVRALKQALKVPEDSFGPEGQKFLLPNAVVEVVDGFLSALKRAQTGDVSPAISGADQLLRISEYINSEWYTPSAEMREALENPSE